MNINLQINKWIITSTISTIKNIDIEFVDFVSNKTPNFNGYKIIKIPLLVSSLIVDAIVSSNGQIVIPIIRESENNLLFLNVSHMCTFLRIYNLKYGLIINKYAYIWFLKYVDNQFYLTDLIFTHRSVTFNNVQPSLILDIYLTHIFNDINFDEKYDYYLPIGNKQYALLKDDVYFKKPNSFNLSQMLRASEFIGKGSYGSVFYIKNSKGAYIVKICNFENSASFANECNIITYMNNKLIKHVPTVYACSFDSYFYIIIENYICCRIGKPTNPIQQENYQKLLQMLNEKKIEHGDLHEGNIIINDSTNEVSIIDFGFAKLNATTDIEQMES